MSSVLTIRGLKIAGQIGRQWNEIVKGIDLDLMRGEVLGLVGESGAGKSTLGLAAMGFCRDGCRFTDGSILLNGEDLRRASTNRLRAIRGRSVAYVAQSAAASFNPAHRLIDQFVEGPLQHGTSNRRAAAEDA